MITHSAAVDGAGWVRVLMQGEGRRPLPLDEHPLDQETHEVVRAHRAFRVLAGELTVPHDDRDALVRYRQMGSGGAEAVTQIRDLRALRSRFRDAGPPPVQGFLPAGLHADPIDFPDVPGLSLRPFGLEALPLLAPAAVAAGIYLATCPPGAPCGCTPPEAHPWLMLAGRLDNRTAWQFALEFNGRPLQHEVLAREGALATFSLTFHHTRERPSWFWREAERPVFQALREGGVQVLQSRTRADRPDWIQSLQDNYGARLIGDWGVQPGELLTRRLEFPLDMGVFKGWPVRTAVGFDTTVGAVRVWEAGAGDLPAVRQLIQDTVPAGQRQIAAQVLEEWWTLDRATVLLGAKAGQLRYARMIRHRKPGQASLAIVGALFDEPEQATVTDSIRGWLQQAGYATVSSFVPERLMANAKMQAQLTRAGSRVVRTRAGWKEPFVEVEMDV